MKHLSLILLLAVAGMFIKAQTETTGVIINYKALENKLEKRYIFSIFVRV